MATKWSGGLYSFNNYSQMEVRVRKELDDIMKDYMENEVMDKLREIMLSEIYRYPASWNNGEEEGRTYQFLNAWEIRTLKRGFYNKEIIEIKDENITWNKWSHGSRQYGAIDADELANIIENGHRNTGYGFPKMKGRHYWKKFERWLAKDFEKGYKKKCKEYGLYVK